MSFSRSAWLKGVDEEDESDDEILDEQVHSSCIVLDWFLIILMALLLA